jgi:hypothetical protein
VPTVRVFVSYAHEDFAIAERIANVLKHDNVSPDWDRNVEPGTAFTTAIQGRILHSHVFMPLLTEKSHQRPWIHQETGYAMALNIPVLPLVIGEVKDLTPTMTAQLQAVVVPELRMLEDKLGNPPIGVIVRQLVQPQPFMPRSLVEIAYWPEARTELLGRYADRVLDLARQAHVAPTLRQRGALSSFTIPDEDLSAPVWKQREKPKDRSDYYHYLQRLERQALERCTHEGGCRLLIDPAIHREEARGVSLDAQAVRFRTLAAFLNKYVNQRAPEEGKPCVEIVVSPVPISGNLTIVGDWFYAESLVPRAGKGYYQTVFNWHAPSAYQKAIEFDKEFDEACERKILVGVPAVLKHLQGLITEIDAKCSSSQ